MQGSPFVSLNYVKKHNDIGVVLLCMRDSGCTNKYTQTEFHHALLLLLHAGIARWYYIITDALLPV